jgi:hypothetical protein
VIVRSDAPAGVQAAQIIHAAGESGPARPGTYAVALAAGPEALHQLELDLAEAGVAFVAIREPDPPWSGALMAIGLHPAHKEQLRRYVRHLPLLR